MIKTLPSDCSSLTDLFKTSTVLQTFTLTQLNSCQGDFMEKQVFLKETTVSLKTGANYKYLFVCLFVF